MGERGPLPKENPIRRNKESQPVEVIDDPKVKIKTPKLGTYRFEVEEVTGLGSHKRVFAVVKEFEYGPHARAVWDQVWQSALAKQFRPEMMETLWRWVKLVDRFHEHGDHSVNRELVAIEKEFALTWSAQKRHRLVFFSGTAVDGKPDGDDAADPPAPPTPVRNDDERRARIRAVGS